MAKKSNLTTQLGIPKRVLEMATHKEISIIQSLCNKRQKLRQAYLLNQSSNSDWHHRHIISSELTGFRKILRNRYSNSLKSGIYKVTRSNVYPLEKTGIFGSERKWRERFKKGILLTWVERDELGINWFLYNGKLYGVNGASIDSIAHLEQCSIQK